ncbi:hypothetical protein [Desulfospira joergensenii]|uniref:hypothetical protein n=1 Tax=Desulfospira joergensenii TaxID=53329 RepID=UPI0003B77AA2|nr:hypothetical protein [Desulfospira joergensenii]
MTLPHRSPFLTRQIPILLSRFSISFEQELSCLEYFLSTPKDPRPFSRSLVVSHETFSDSLYVSKFYPEIYKELNCKYLSAACFYMIIHHAVSMFHLPDRCRVNLETDTGVFQKFYSRLNDFNFKICYTRPAEKVYLRGNYCETEFKVNMIRPAS